MANFFHPKEEFQKFASSFIFKRNRMLQEFPTTISNGSWNI